MRIGGIALDFAPQAVDLNVDGAFAAIGARGQLLAVHGLAGPVSEQPQHVPLALGQAHRHAVALELAAGDMERERTEGDLFGGAPGVSLPFVTGSHAPSPASNE